MKIFWAWKPETSMWVSFSVPWTPHLAHTGSLHIWNYHYLSYRHSIFIKFCTIFLIGYHHSISIFFYYFPGQFYYTWESWGAKVFSFMGKLSQYQSILCRFKACLWQMKNWRCLFKSYWCCCWCWWWCWCWGKRWRWLTAWSQLGDSLMACNCCWGSYFGRSTQLLGLLCLWQCKFLGCRRGGSSCSVQKPDFNKCTPARVN